MHHLFTLIREDAVRRSAVVRRSVWSAVLSGTRKAKEAARTSHGAVDKALAELEHRASRAIEAETESKERLRAVEQRSAHAA
jgi:hypothetical protein